MSGPFVNNDEGQCPKAEWFRGCKQPRDPGMPERVWGAYLPGDEPGYNCSVTGNPCAGEVHFSECPRVVRAKKLCPVCFEEGRVAALKVDPEDPALPHWCPQCDNYWEDLQDLQDEWTRAVEAINERYAEVVRIPAGLPEHVHDDYGQQLAM